MTTYAGETLTVWQTVTNNGVALTVDDVEEVTIEIYSVADEEEILDSGVMDWSEDNDRWEYIWDTTGLVFGTYLARIAINGENWEYKRMRLARNKFEVDF